MEFIIITGLSGSGKSTAIAALEDIGFFCVDNMLPALLPKFVQLCTETGHYSSFQSGKATRGYAFVTDIRSGEMFFALNGVIEELKKSGIKVKVMFLNASDEIIKRRYKETRRPHPLLDNTGEDISAAVRSEREILAPIMEIADYKIDVNTLSATELKQIVRELFLEQNSDSMLIKCTSFGFKFGTPGDADLVLDVRCLSNPFYIDELKNKTGLDAAVRDFVMGSDDSRELELLLNNLLDFLIPRYIAEGKSQLVIAFGCTGGKHRSVTFAERLHERLEGAGYRAITFHRDLSHR